MVWYVIDMPEASLTDGVYHRFCRKFQRAFIDAGAPPDLALFAERNTSSEERRLYLSPESESFVPDMMREYDAASCRAPDPDRVTLVYGVPGAQMLLTQPDPLQPDPLQPDQLQPDQLQPDQLQPARRQEMPTIYPFTRGRAVASGG